MMKVLAGLITIAAVAAIGMNTVRNSVQKSGSSQKKSPNPQITNSLSIKGGSREVITDEPVYFENVKGFLAKPKEEGTYPGVVMIHEWWGLNDNIKVMAQKLASEGYVVLAVDLFDSQVASNPEEARTLTSNIDETRSIENMQAAVSYLKEQGAPKIASLGWCFGGGQSLQLSLSGQPLDATILYYGAPVTDSSRLSNIKWPVLGIFGDKDQSIPMASVNKFESALSDLGVENEVYIYPGVGHAFANPTGDNYAPKETEDAWNKTVGFLNRSLKMDSI